MAIGIYQITIGPNFYIGQTIDLDRRGKNHKYTLNKGIHRNRYVQNSFNKYQEFKYNVLGECTESMLDKLEQEIIDIVGEDPRCMNICKKVVTSNRGVKFSAITKKRMSLSQSGENNPMYGKKHTKESLDKISKHSKGSNHSQYNHTIYTFIHKNGKIEECTMYDLKKTYGMEKVSSNLSRMISGKNKTCNGWRLKDGK